jgi:urease accessory protein UreF
LKKARACGFGPVRGLENLSRMTPIEKNARPAGPGWEGARSEADELLGEFSALLRQIGSPGLDPGAEATIWTAAIDSPSAFCKFLEDYLDRLLLPSELPAIVASCGHARRGELRELLAQDLRLAAPLVPTPFAAPSRRMGWLQLVRLRPLRDERIVQRYLAAVQSGQAHGWHTLVYGMTLAVYSLPLRQGLLHYSQETLAALVSAAGRSKNFSESDLAQTLSALFARIPQAVEAALAADETCGRAANDCGQLSPGI